MLYSFISYISDLITLVIQFVEFWRKLNRSIKVNESNWVLKCIKIEIWLLANPLLFLIHDSLLHKRSKIYMYYRCSECCSSFTKVLHMFETLTFILDNIPGFNDRNASWILIMQLIISTFIASKIRLSIGMLFKRGIGV